MDETTVDTPQQPAQDSVVINSIQPHPEPNRVSVNVTVTVDDKAYTQELNLPDNEEDILTLVERYAKEYKQGLQAAPEPTAAETLQEVVGTEIEVS